MPPPQVKFNSIHALLEQALRNKRKFIFHEGCFSKILLTNRAFTSLANKRGVYQFYILGLKDERILLTFRTCTDVYTPICWMPIQQLRRFLSFLQPACLFVYYGFEKQMSQKNLLNIVQSRIHLKAPEKLNIVTFLPNIWTYVHEFTCHKEYFTRNGTNPTKTFDNLCVKEIWYIDDLLTVLGQPAKCLDLYFSYFFKGNRNQSNVQSPNNLAKKCHLHFCNADSLDSIVLAVQTVLSACFQLDQLEVTFKSSSYYHQSANKVISEEVVVAYRSFCKLAEFLQGTKPALKLSMSFVENYYASVCQPFVKLQNMINKEVANFEIKECTSKHNSISPSLKLINQTLHPMYNFQIDFLCESEHERDSEIAMCYM